MKKKKLETRGEINRRNASHSTGPRTPEGLKASSRNSLKHGITSSQLTAPKDSELPISSPDQDGLYQEVRKGLNPQDGFEEILVKKIASDYHRLQRVVGYEESSLRKLFHELRDRYYLGEGAPGGNPRLQDQEIDDRIADLEEGIEWRNHFIRALKQGNVDLKMETWEQGDGKRYLRDDLQLLYENVYRKWVADGITDYPYWSDARLDHPTLVELLFNGEPGISQPDAAKALAELLEAQNIEDRIQIEKLEQGRLENLRQEELLAGQSRLPGEAETAKILRYETTIQNSIIRSFALLMKHRFPPPRE